MRNILLIAKREYLEQIRGRAFKISTVLVPLLIVGMMGASYVMGKKANTGQHFAIAADSAPLADAVRSEMLNDKDAHFTVDIVAPATQQDRAELLDKVKAKSIDGILAIDLSPTGEITASYTSQSSGDFANVGRMQNSLNRGTIHWRLTADGMKPSEADAALKWIPVETLQLDKTGKAGKSSGMAQFYKAFTILMLLSVPIMLYGMDMARAIIEEKSSRIFEVMLSVARADDLLTGKLIGVGGVALTQVAIWVLAAALFMGSALAATVLTGNLAIHFSWAEAILFPVYFVLGFFLYSALFSGLAATCETAQELQMYVPLVIIPVYTGMGVLPLLLKDSNSVWAAAASIFPFTAPFVMMPRIGLQMPPLWQIGLSIGLTVLSIWGALWFSSRLYRVGILMYGKRATLPEIVHWLRYS
jgi:ABC-2 type transport system permease protein